MGHISSGSCPKCAELFEQYPHFYPPLRDWFEKVQAKHPKAHISCAGRGKVDQEVCFDRKASRAHWMQSSHNFGAAIDIFIMENGQATWPKDWFNNSLAPMLPDWVAWYGRPDAKFHELPHCEVVNWRDLVKLGDLKPVEGG